jgi:hypothetical protein
MLQTSPHSWAGNIAVAAYSIGSAAVLLALCGALDVRFPLLGQRLARPSFPVLPDPPQDDVGTGLRQSLDANLLSGLGEALEASGIKRRTHAYCATCGYPFSRPLLTATCTAPGICRKRLETSIAQRLRLGEANSPLRVHPQWLAEHTDAT